MAPAALAPAAAFLADAARETITEGRAPRSEGGTGADRPTGANGPCDDADPSPGDPGIASGDPGSASTSLPAGKCDGSGNCTQAQLRRFIKSRPYVPMHELRRRFELNGSADEVVSIPTAQGVAYIGLSPREAAFVAELLRQGDIGLELCHDPTVPIVVGVYAMKPVSR